MKRRDAEGEEEVGRRVCLRGMVERTSVQHSLWE